MRRIDCIIVAIFVLLLVYMAAITFTSPYPNGRDVWFHILVARSWYRGENGMVSAIVMDFNNIPYPPLFYVLLIPFASSLDLCLFVAKILQLVFYPFGVLALMLLIRKYSSSETAIIFGLTLIGTYFSFSQMQVKPQSLTMLLFPIAIWAFLENKAKTFILVATAMFYIYSPYGLAFLAGIFIYALKQNFRDRRVWVTLILVLPILIYQLSFIDGLFLNRWVTYGDRGLIDETKKFVTNPIWFTFDSFGFTTFAIPLIFHAFYTWNSCSKLTKIMVCSFFGMLIVYPIWIQRTFSLIIAPLAYLMTIYVTKTRNPKVKAILIGVFLIQAIVFSLFPVWWMSPAPYMAEYW